MHNGHGEADGFLLTDGGEVHVPPHLSSRLLRDVRPGSEVKVRGIRPRTNTPGDGGQPS